MLKALISQYKLNTLEIKKNCRFKEKSHFSQENIDNEDDNRSKKRRL